MCLCSPVLVILHDLPQYWFPLELSAHISTCINIKDSALWDRDEWVRSFSGILSAKKKKSQMRVKSGAMDGGNFCSFTKQVNLKGRKHGCFR